MMDTWNDGLPGVNCEVRSIADGDYKRFLIVDGDTVRCGVG